MSADPPAISTDLANVRKGQFEGLKELIGKDETRAPDFGPNAIHPTAGAVAVGARQQIVNFNVNLDTHDMNAGKDIAMEGAMAKLFSSQVAERVTSISLELFGGYGYTKDYPAEKFYRDAKIGAIYEGTSNMQLQTIAKGMLR